MSARRAARPSRRLARRFFGIVLVLGICCLLYPIATNVAYQLGAYSAVSTYDDAVGRYGPEELDRLWAEAYAYNDELASPEVRDPFAYDEVVAPLDRYYRVLDPDGTGMMGYVEVPSVGLELPIYHGTAEDTLEKGAGHLATTALPLDGTSLHPVITGHTGLPDKLLFTSLALVREGDLFRVRILDRTFSYRVASIDVVEPDDTALLQPVAGENRLTLLTCTLTASTPIACSSRACRRQRMTSKVSGPCCCHRSSSRQRRSSLSQQPRSPFAGR